MLMVWFIFKLNKNDPHTIITSRTILKKDAECHKKSYLPQVQGGKLPSVILMEQMLFPFFDVTLFSFMFQSFRSV